MWWLILYFYTKLGYEKHLEYHLPHAITYWEVQVWNAYKDQRHDLFLPSNAQTSPAGVAGLIESSSSRLTYALAAPPPQSNQTKSPTTVGSDSNGNQG